MLQGSLQKDVSQIYHYEDLWRRRRSRRGKRRMRTRSCGRQLLVCSSREGIAGSLKIQPPPPY
jgi:hypothetical protein